MSEQPAVAGTDALLLILGLVLVTFGLALLLEGSVIPAVIRRMTRTHRDEDAATGRRDGAARADGRLDRDAVGGRSDDLRLET